MLRHTLALLGLTSCLISPFSHAADCGSDTLGTSRVITLPRAAAAYGTFQHPPLPLAPGEVVLTFDDGPRPESTPLVLKALEAQCVKASFFLIGSEMLRSPDLARQVLKAGHAVGGHGFQHDHFPQLKPEQQLGNLKPLQLAFQTVFGFGPAAFRFPYFEESQPMLGELEKQGLIVMSADLAIDDWVADQSPAMLEARLLERLK